MRSAEAELSHTFSKKSFSKNLFNVQKPRLSSLVCIFANKNESGATEIYRAKDFGLHKEVSILNAYRAGKLGAKPQLGSIFIDE